MSVLDSTLDITINDALDEVFKKTEDNFADMQAKVESFMDKESISAADSLSLQVIMMKYTLYQESISKVVSKAANGVNEVAKAS